MISHVKFPHFAHITFYFTCETMWFWKTSYDIHFCCCSFTCENHIFTFEIIFTREITVLMWNHLFTCIQYRVHMLTPPFTCENNMFSPHMWIAVSHVKIKFWLSHVKNFQMLWGVVLWYHMLKCCKCAISYYHMLLLHVVILTSHKITLKTWNSCFFRKGSDTKCTELCPNTLVNDCRLIYSHAVYSAVYTV